MTQLAPLPQAFVGSIRSVRLRGSGKAIALTFDLCETEGRPAGYEGAIADYLRRERVKATFFAGGRWIQSHPERAMQLMADPLFELGNHGWAHRNARRLSEQDLSQEVLRPQSEYELLREELASRLCTRAVHPRELAKIPKTPLAFRFPYGACTEEALAFVARAGLPAIQWDVVTGDASAEQTAGGVAREVFRAARPGSILVAHANGRGHGTAEALPLFVPELRRRGFEFVTVTELLGAGEPVVAQSCYILKPGDTVRYDRLKRKP